MGWNEIKTEDLEDLPNWKLEEILKLRAEHAKCREVVLNASNGWFNKSNYDFTNHLVQQTFIKIAIKAIEKCGYEEVIKWV